ncbi:hypothetical protein C9374_005205 [Naegleria lovaniensis]|uniref:Uncharacterized protein n=1 Tax=Naegleria lovaniensis TaxID=51637 RepID=A0AA88KKG9_NAELO|nr:uncharacterized protein C9374_005205 [Naegleria lovaniensis]KAG2382625.1 hypothetical protein C9374_005205 [Naegleria lovaniensis]
MKSSSTTRLEQEGENDPSSREHVSLHTASIPPHPLSHHQQQQQHEPFEDCMESSSQLSNTVLDDGAFPLSNMLTLHHPASSSPLVPSMYQTIVLPQDEIIHPSQHMHHHHYHPQIHETHVSDSSKSPQGTLKQGRPRHHSLPNYSETHASHGFLPPLPSFFLYMEESLDDLLALNLEYYRPRVMNELRELRLMESKEESSTIVSHPPNEVIIDQGNVSSSLFESNPSSQHESTVMNPMSSPLLHTSTITSKSSSLSSGNGDWRFAHDSNLFHSNESSFPSGVEPHVVHARKSSIHSTSSSNSQIGTTSNPMNIAVLHHSHLRENQLQPGRNHHVNTISMHSNHGQQQQPQNTSHGSSGAFFHYRNFVSPSPNSSVGSSATNSTHSELTLNEAKNHPRRKPKGYDHMVKQFTLNAQPKPKDSDSRK